MKEQRPNQKPCSLAAGGVLSGVFFVTLLTLSGSASSALAQVAPNNFAPSQSQVVSKPARPGASNITAATPKAEPKPHWKDLNAVQQQSLKPLAMKWNTLSEGQKRKWLEISRNYASLPPSEQAKLHSRMSEWVSLSPQQRAQARLNFAETKQLSASEKAATWEAYQALSPEERQQLATKAPRQPSGAAVAVKPTPPEKLAVVPVSRQTAKHPPRLAGATHSLDQHTLLPQQVQEVDSAAVQKH